MHLRRPLVGEEGGLFALRCFGVEGGGVPFVYDVKNKKINSN